MGARSLAVSADRSTRFRVLDCEQFGDDIPGPDGSVQRDCAGSQWIQQCGESELQRWSDVSAFELCNDAFEFDSDCGFQR
jgi:hypothetical protein